MLLVAVLLLVGLADPATPPYVVPEPLIQAFSPAGLQVSIPDSAGVQLFAFHGSVNKPLKGLEAGDMSRDVLTRTRGRWVFEEPQTQLLPGDIVYYWLYVLREGLGYRKDASYWIVDALQPVLPISPAQSSSSSSDHHEIISSLLKNNCSSDALGSALTNLLEGYEFVMVVKNGKLQLKDSPSSG